MGKIIDRNYLFQLVDRISTPAPYKGVDPLYKLKQRFPRWLRALVFSWINPLYLGYIYRQSLRERREINHRMRNPFTVSFMTYCFREEYSLDLDEYYPVEDHPTLERYVENRVRSLFLERLPIHAFSEDPGLEGRIKAALKGVLKMRRNGSYLWRIGGTRYYISSRPEVSATYYHLGIPRLPESVVERLKGRVFIDGGAYNGDTAIAMLPYQPGEIWCFEPDRINMELLRQTIRQNGLEDTLIPFEAGIGEKSEQLRFTGTGILSSRIDREGSSTIEVRSIDDVAEERNREVGLIKLDIEGFELEALRGAEKTLQKYRPVLLISAYHTGKDFFEIPGLLKKCVPAYQLRFFDLEPFSPMLGEKMIVAYVS